MSARTAFPDSLDPTTLWALRAVLGPMPPTSVSHPDVKAITVFLASTATPERGGLPYLDAVLPAEHRLAATRVVRDLGALPPDAILYLLAQPLLDLASDHLMRDRDLTARYEVRGALRGRGHRRVDRCHDRVQPRGRRAHRRPLSCPGGAGVGARLLHGSARLRPPDGARAATLLRPAERRARRLSAVEGHHRLTCHRIAQNAQGVL